MEALQHDERAAEVERLLVEGEELYSGGHTDEAIARWTEVLHLSPDDHRAAELLEKAGVEVQEGVELLQPGSHAREQLERLLRERRYEEALKILHEARWQAPNAAEISRSIQLLKQRLIRRYLQKIGSLDRVPRFLVGEEELAALELEEDERELLRLVDGISSFGDIAAESRLGRFETYRALARMVTEGALSAEPVAGEKPPPRTPTAPVTAEAIAVARAETARGGRAWGWLIEAAVVAGLAAMVAVIAVGRRGAETENETETATVAENENETEAAAAAEIAHLAEAGAAAGVMAAAEAAQARAAADAAVALAEADAGAAAPEEIVVEPEPEPDPAPSPGKAARVKQRVAGARTQAAPPAPASGAASSAAAAPVAPEPAGAAAEPPAPAAEHAPPVGEVAAVVSPPKPTAAPAPAPVPPPAPNVPVDVRATAGFDGVELSGGIARGIVEAAIGRVVPAYQACYDTASKRAGKRGPATVKASFVLDEAGRARDAGVAEAGLPGLSDCLRDAIRGIRSRVVPDVGLVSVSFDITFKGK